MQTIPALIFSYLVFVTRTWAVTRLAVLICAVMAVIYDFTPLRRYLGYMETALLTTTFVLWLVNIIVDRKPSPSA